jgi:hypothetical protein
MKPSVKIVFLIVLLIAIGGLFAGLYLYNLKPKDLQKAKPHYSISAVDFQKAFDENEKAASARYINKIIEVSGTIGSVKTGEKNTFNVTLITGNELSSIIGTFHNISDTTVFKTRNQIIIRGVCSGFLMDVLLNNCVVVKSGK